MKHKSLIRIGAYAVLTLGLLIFGGLFLGEYAEKQDYSRQLREAQQNEDGNQKLPPPPENNFALFLALSLGCGLGLAGMIAREVADYFGQTTLDFVFNDDLEGMRSPEYEAAENEWNNGRYLEAIKMLRAYYEKHPREVYVAIRIAEIYETNLRNHLAAALEYEEILKKPLPAERWGWAAIHLVNLYSGKLDKPDQAMALLQRIANEYSQTAAAKKARVRLGLPEELPATPAPAKAAAPAPVGEELEEEPETETANASNLPAGFSPRSGAEESKSRPASEMVEMIKKATRDSGEPTPVNLPPGFRPKDK